MVMTTFTIVLKEFRGRGDGGLGGEFGCIGHVCRFQFH